MARKAKIVGLTGAGGSTGRRLRALLDDDPAVAATLMLDGVCAKDEIDTLVHLGDGPFASVKANKLVMVSSTRCYGASASNPSFIDEDAGLAVTSETERFAHRFAQTNPRATVTLLRPCTVVGPTVDNAVARFFSRRIVPTVFGHDPLLQFLHEDDLVAALKLAIDGNAPGAFNLAGDGVLPLSSVLKLTGALRLRVPYHAARLLRPSAVDHLRFACVADNARAKAVLGFAPVFSSKAALIDYVQTLNLRRIAA